MQINQSTNTVEQYGNQFTIAATGKAFRILSDGLYSDKIKAIIRELSCNARDSHVAAGNGSPWEMHLPSHDEQWFEVIDHGTGLSDDDVNNIYTRYFASTKTTSNAFVGQLGLGSKSPFSYTREFWVTSRHGGIENRYRMYFDASDTPCVEHLCSGPATGTGISVRFTVTHGYDRWHSKARDVLQWFDQAPIIHNAEINLNQPAAHLEGDGWRIYTNNWWNGSDLQARMGGVLYPIDLSSIPDPGHDALAMMSLPMVADFGIGELDVAASREGLSYDARTCDAIRSKLESIARDIKDRIQADVSRCGTMWQAKLEWNRWFRGVNAYVFRNLVNDAWPTWNGTAIADDYVKVDLKDGNAVAKLLADGSRSAKGTGYEFHIYAKPKAEIWIDDCPRGGQNRLRYHHNEIGNGRERWMFTGVVDQGALTAMLGHPEVLYTSSLPVPPRKPRASTGDVFLYRNRGWGMKAWQKVKQEDVPDEDRYYVVLNGWDVTSGSDYMSKEGFDALVREISRNTLMHAEVADLKIYGLRKSQAEKIKDEDGWVQFYPAMLEAARLKLSMPEVQRAIDSDAAYTGIRDVAVNQMFRLGEEFDAISTMVRDPDSDFIRCLGMLRGLNDGKDPNMMSYRALAGCFKIPLPPAAPPDDTAKQYQHMASKYDMIRHLSVGYRIEPALLKSIASYVDAVDMSHVYLTLTAEDAEGDE